MHDDVGCYLVILTIWMSAGNRMYGAIFVADAVESCIECSHQRWAGRSRFISGATDHVSGAPEINLLRPAEMMRL